MARVTFMMTPAAAWAALAAAAVLALAVCVPACGAWASGAARSSTYSSDCQGARFEILGTEANVAEGVVPDELADCWVEAGAYDAFFDIGSPRSLASMGEMVGIGGLAYTRSTDNTSADYFETVSGPAFLSTVAMLLPHGQDVALRMSAEANGTFDELVATLYARAGGVPICYVGSVLTRHLDANALSLAPIYGENLDENLDKYVSQPPVDVDGQPMVVMGCAVNYAEVDDPDYFAQLTRVVPYNADAGDTVTTHTHCLLTGEYLRNWRDLTAADVMGVDHIDGSTTTVAQVDVGVYPICRVDSYAGCGSTA